MRLKHVAGVVLITCLVLTGCSSSRPNVVGMWTDVSGATRVFSADGTCQNIAPIDIGGPAPTYNLAETVGEDGRYALRIAQGGMNEWTMYVEVIGRDRLKVYETASATDALYDLTRQ